MEIQNQCDKISESEEKMVSQKFNRYQTGVLI